MPLSSQVECDQVDGGHLGVDFSVKSGHVSVPQRIAGLIIGHKKNLQRTDCHIAPGSGEWITGLSPGCWERILNVIFYTLVIHRTVMLDSSVAQNLALYKMCTYSTAQT